MIKRSFTREDPEVELFALNYLNKKFKKILLKGNCGNTLLSILSQTHEDDFLLIDIIENKDDQLALVELKTSLFYEINKSEFMEYINGTNKKIDLKTLSSSTKEFWNKNYDLIKKGLNNIGLDDILFDEIRKDKFNFFKYLDDETSDHYTGVKDIFKIIYSKPEDNYFYYHFMTGKYSDTDKPLFIKNYENKYPIGINYISHDIITYLKNIKEKYDFIGLSNYIDELKHDEIKLLIFYCYQKLENKGILVLRRFMNNFSIRDYIKNGNLFKIIDDSLIDKSFMFKEILVLEKL